MYYIFIQDNKINGAGEVPIVNEEILSVETTEEIYNNYINDDKTYAWDGENIIPNPNYEKDKTKEEAERIAKLHLTGADVERALIKALNVDFDDIVAMVQAKKPEQVKMLKAELKANYFYRGNPYVEMLGVMLGLTSGQLNVFFETNNYLYLTNCTLTINPKPVDATVTINDVIGNSATVPYGTPIVWSVSAEGYKSQDGNLEIKQHTQLDIVLEKKEVLDDSTTDKQPDTIPDETTIKTDQGE